MTTTEFPTAEFIPFLNVAVPVQSQITTREELNQMIDRGFTFTAELIVSKERVKIYAVRAVVRENVLSVVIRENGRSHFADVKTCSVRYGRF